MRIATASTVVPFATDGGRPLARELAQALSRHGHQVDEILFPFSPDPEELIEQLLALRLLDVSTDSELLICLGAQSSVLRHPNKVVWLPHDDRSEQRADRLGLGEARRVYAISRALAERLRAADLSCEVLDPPAEEGAWEPVIEALTR